MRRLWFRWPWLRISQQYLVGGKQSGQRENEKAGSSERVFFPRRVYPADPAPLRSSLMACLLFYGSTFLRRGIDNQFDITEDRHALWTQNSNPFIEAVFDTPGYVPPLRGKCFPWPVRSSMPLCQFNAANHDGSSLYMPRVKKRPFVRPVYQVINQI